MNKQPRPLQPSDLRPATEHDATEKRRAFAEVLFREQAFALMQRNEPALLEFLEQTVGSGDAIFYASDGSGPGETEPRALRVLSWEAVACAHGVKGEHVGGGLHRLPNLAYHRGGCAPEQATLLAGEESSRRLILVMRGQWFVARLDHMTSAALRGVNC